VLPDALRQTSTPDLLHASIGDTPPVRHDSRFKKCKQIIVFDTSLFGFRPRGPDRHFL
jgi:hypothetical protein